MYTNNEATRALCGKFRQHGTFVSHLGVRNSCNTRVSGIAIKCLIWHDDKNDRQLQNYNYLKNGYGARDATFHNRLAMLFSSLYIYSGRGLSSGLKCPGLPHSALGEKNEVEKKIHFCAPSPPQNRHPKNRFFALKHVSEHSESI